MRKKLDSWMEFLWSDDQKHSKLVLFFIKAARMVSVLLKHLLRGQLTLRAMSLVYTTLLSLVPLLAVSFSVLKGFGVHNQIEPLLLSFFAPIGPRAAELTEKIIGFVENMKVGVLGSLGLAFLLYTVVSLTQKVESSFNHVWRVERMRGFAKRFANYLSVIMIGPVLVFAALGVTATVMNNEFVQYVMHVEPFGHLLLAAGKLLPYVLVISVFTFLYLFLPNTDVHFLPALAGGIVAGIIWESSGWVFASFIANSSKYTAIYSGFAIVVMLMIWLYLSWLILLLGSQVAFYVQNPKYVTRNPVKLVLSNRLRETMALEVMYQVARQYMSGKKPLSMLQLVERLEVPALPVEKLMADLIDADLLVEVAGDVAAFLPGRDVDTVSVGDILKTVRKNGESGFLAYDAMPHSGAVANIMQKSESSYENAFSSVSLRDMVAEKQEG